MYNKCSVHSAVLCVLCIVAVKTAFGFKTRFYCSRLLQLVHTWIQFSECLLIDNKQKVIMQPSYRLHYASCSSICLSVIMCGLVKSKTKKKQKSKSGTSKWSAGFSVEKVEGRGHWASKTFTAIWGHVYLQWQSQRQWPILLPMPEMLGDWMDGRISCQHSALSFFLYLYVVCATFCAVAKL